jgi:hypothetical protein
MIPGGTIYNIMLLLHSIYIHSRHGNTISYYYYYKQKRFGGVFKQMV